jgi:hypothetical protein
VLFLIILLIAVVLGAAFVNVFVGTSNEGNEPEPPSAGRISTNAAIVLGLSLLVIFVCLWLSLFPPFGA